MKIDINQHETPVKIETKPNDAIQSTYDVDALVEATKRMAEHWKFISMSYQEEILKSKMKKHM